MIEQLSCGPQDGNSIAYTGDPYFWPNSPAPDTQRLGSTTSTDTVNRISHRKISSGSVGSSKFTPPGPLRVRNENVVPSQTISLSTLDFLGGSTNVSTPRRTSFQASHKSSWSTDIPAPPRSRQISALVLDAGPLDDVDLNAGCGETDVSSVKDTHGGFDQGSTRGLSFEATAEENPYMGSLEPIPSSKEKNTASVATDPRAHIFSKWLHTPRHKNMESTTSASTRWERWSLDESDEPKGVVLPISASMREKHKKSSSTSSSGFVTAIKSATVSLAALSVAPKSRKARRSTLKRSSKRSGRLSHTTNRASLESCTGSVRLLDEAAWDRAVQRRRALEELVSSEESYIADLKVLINGYFPLLASSPSPSPRTQTQIHRNVTEILALHEDLLAQIRRVVPNSDLRSDLVRPDASTRPARCAHPPSADSPRVFADQESTPARRSLEVSKLEHPRKATLIAEPQEAAKVAKVFDRMLARLFAYEEYSAEYESFKQDVAAISRNIPNWHAYERGIEALANSLAPSGKEDAYSKKGLTFEDLVIKPVQRVCKYPLLFADLCKHTPVIDCPESHAKIEKVQCRLHETIQEINTATNDQKTRDNIQRTWQLQDLLVFPNASSPPFPLRMLGHPALCGVLHVAYHSKHGVRGDYMLCVLFKSCLILAMSDADAQRFQIVACAGLRDFRVESTENGKGLQCHTALYSWKIVFESGQRLFEMILSACSALEEEVWRTRLLDWSAAEGRKQAEVQPNSRMPYSILSLDLKAIGHVFGHPGTLARQISVQRAATVGPKTDVCQVIIKDTHALKELGGIQLPLSPSINRSQSLLSTNRIPVLTPKRAERIRIEQALAEVWTRDALPYPGMMYRRGDHVIRASASSVMRKLSRASKASSFTKRTASQTSLASLTTSRLHLTEDEIEEAYNVPVTNSQRLVSSPNTNTISMNRNLAGVQLHHVVSPPRTSSASGMKRDKIARHCQSSNDLKASQSSHTGVEKSSAEQAEIDNKQSAKTRWSSPVGLVRAFSTEGIRALFF